MNSFSAFSFAKGKSLRISPLKCRLVADQIRGQKVERALDILTFSKKKSAHLIKKVLISACHNAVHNDSMNYSNLVVFKICVDGGFKYKRMKPRAKGRGNRILKPTSNILIFVSEKDN